MGKFRESRGSFVYSTWRPDAHARTGARFSSHPFEAQLILHRHVYGSLASSDILGIDHLRPAVGLIRTARYCIAAGSP